MWLITDDVNFDHMVKIAFPKFLYCEVISPNLFKTPVFGLKSQSTAHIQGIGN
jgi:hypothetical protein